MNIKTAERIRELRTKNNMTQAELARKLYVTRSSVNAWEMAISVPAAEKLSDLCRLLHTSADYLLGIDSDESISIGHYSAEQKELLYGLIRYFDGSAAGQIPDDEPEQEC